MSTYVGNDINDTGLPEKPSASRSSRRTRGRRCSPAPRGWVLSRARWQRVRPRALRRDLGSSTRMSDDLFSLEGRVAVHTGGAGQLGPRDRERARRRRGMKVAALRPCRATEHRVDVTDPDQVAARSHANGRRRARALWHPARPRERSGARLPAQCAGGGGRAESRTYPPQSSFDAVMDVNVKGTFFTCQAIGARDGGGGPRLGRERIDLHLQEEEEEGGRERERKREREEEEGERRREEEGGRREEEEEEEEEEGGREGGGGREEERREGGREGGEGGREEEEGGREGGMLSPVSGLRVPATRR